MFVSSYDSRPQMSRQFASRPTRNSKVKRREYREGFNKSTMRFQSRSGSLPLALSAIDVPA